MLIQLQRPGRLRGFSRAPYPRLLLVKKKYRTQIEPEIRRFRTFNAACAGCGLVQVKPFSPQAGNIAKLIRHPIIHVKWLFHCRFTRLPIRNRSTEIPSALSLFSVVNEENDAAARIFVHNFVIIVETTEFFSNITLHIYL